MSKNLNVEGLFKVRHCNNMSGGHKCGKVATSEVVIAGTGKWVGYSCEKHEAPVRAQNAAFVGKGAAEPFALIPTNL